MKDKDRNEQATIRILSSFGGDFLPDDLLKETALPLSTGDTATNNRGTNMMKYDDSIKPGQVWPDSNSHLLISCKRMGAQGAHAFYRYRITVANPAP